MHYSFDASQPVEAAFKNAYGNQPILYALVKSTDNYMRNKQGILKASEHTQTMYGGPYDTIEYFEKKEGQTLMHMNDMTCVSISAPSKSERGLQLMSENADGVTVALNNEGTLSVGCISKDFNEEKYNDFLQTYLYGSAQELSAHTLKFNN